MRLSCVTVRAYLAVLYKTNVSVLVFSVNLSVLYNAKTPVLSQTMSCPVQNKCACLAFSIRLSVSPVQDMKACLVSQAVVDCGALESLVTCLEEFDPGVKEAASWTLGYVAGHSPELAQQVSLPKNISLCHSEGIRQQCAVALRCQHTAH